MQLCKRKIFGLGTATLVFSNENLNDIMKIVKFFVDGGLLIKGISEAIENKAKEQKGAIACMLLGTLGTSLLGSLLPGVVACTCNPATLEAEFRNGVGLIPVGGNSPSIGGGIV